MNIRTGITRAILTIVATSAALGPALLNVPAGSAEPGTLAPVGSQHEATENTPLWGVDTQASVLAEPIARSEVLVRAKRWVDLGVPYSNYVPYQDGYRRDCSGFVSFAWATGTSYNTNSLSTISHRISKEDMLPGDIMLWQNPNWPREMGHVRIFGGWLDVGMSRYWVYEQAPPRAVYREYTWSGTFGQYLPFRYNNIIEDGAPSQPPPPPSVTVLVSQHVADIDGDGKPDVLGLNNGTHDSLWMIPNTSTPGTPDRGDSFHISDGWGMVFNIMLADYDGDGKVDILGRHDDDLLVWRNTSTPGQPSFSGWHHLGTGWGTLTKLLVADFTGDGKADIGGWNSGGADQFWVVPNTSTVGNPSRGTSVRVSTGWQSIDTYLLSDFDGDGRTDILGRTGNEMLAWRNLGANGTPALSGWYSLGTGWNDIGKLLVADFTGDGKPDIGGFDRNTGNQFWVTPNTSTVGNLARGNSFMVSDGWSSVHTFMMADYDGDGKTDILGRHDDALLAWRVTHSNGRPVIGGWSQLGTGWNTIGTYLTRQ